MTAITIDSLVTDRLPQTEAQLISEDSIEWADAKGRAVAMAKITLYGTERAEGSIADDRIKAFIADRAAIQLMDFALDYYMNAARLSDAKEGATLRYYDRVETLKERQAALRRDTAARRPQILDLVEEEMHGMRSHATASVIGISTESSGLATPDPWTRASER